MNALLRLPLGWELATLPDLVSDLGILTDGDWVETVDQDPAGDVRLTQLSDVGDGVFRDRSSRFLTSAKARELGCTFLGRQDLLIARMPDPLGRACLFPGSARRCVTVVDVCIVRPASERVVNRWLMHFVNSPDVRIEVDGLQKGSTRKRISKANLCTIPLPIPPTAEQARIADAVESYLSRLDDAVASLERVRRNLKRYRAAVLQAAVAGRLVPTEADVARDQGRSYESAYELLARILSERRRRWEEAELAKLRVKGKVPKNDAWKEKYVEPRVPKAIEPSTLPEGWCWAFLRDIADLKGGITKDTKRSHEPARIEVPYLRVANVQRGHLDLGEIKTIMATHQEIEDLRLRGGDVLFNEGGDRDKLGRGWIWQEELAECIHQNHVFRARLLDSRIQPKFLSWYGNSSAQRYFIDEGKQTTNLASLNMTKLGALPVPLPPAAEQDRIVQEVERLLSVAEDAERDLKSQLARCHRLRQSILKWAFDGKLVDQDPSNEPASVLLERIRAERAAAEAPARRARPAVARGSTRLRRAQG